METCFNVANDNISTHLDNATQDLGRATNQALDLCRAVSPPLESQGLTWNSVFGNVSGVTNTTRLMRSLQKEIGSAENQLAHQRECWTRVKGALNAVSEPVPRNEAIAGLIAADYPSLDLFYKDPDTLQQDIEAAKLRAREDAEAERESALELLKGADLVSD